MSNFLKQNAPSHEADYISTYNKQYYARKSKINRELLNCSCGKTITKFSFKFHLKSKYHLKHNEIYNEKKRDVFTALRTYIINKKKLLNLYKFYFI
jgi:hypothetical protein